MLTKKISEICSFLPKSKIKAGEATNTGRYVFFTSSDSKHSYLDTYLFDDELVILGTGGFASCNYYKGKFSVSTDNFVLKTTGNILPKFLYYYLRKDNLSILNQGFRGTGLKHISKEYVSDIEIPLFTIDKQHEIINILDNINCAINFEKDLISIYDSLIKSRFNEMFGDIYNNTKGIQMKKIGEIAFVTKLAGFEYTQYINYKDSGEVIMVRGLNCKQGKLNLDDVYYESKDTSNKLPRSKLYKGDIVLTYVGTIGETALIDADDLYHLAPNVAKISIFDKEMNIPTFFVTQFVLFRDYLIHFSNSTSQPKISMEKIRDIPVMVPSTKMQTEFADFVKLIDKLKFIFSSIIF